jgi:hypothetical protein
MLFLKSLLPFNKPALSYLADATKPASRNCHVKTISLKTRNGNVWRNKCYIPLVLKRGMSQTTPSRASAGVKQSGDITVSKNQPKHTDVNPIYTCCADLENKLIYKQITDKPGLYL